MIKNTLARGATFHFYEQPLDNTKVFLEFDEVEIDLSIRSNGRSLVRMAIPVEEWRKINDGWKNSDWAQNTERDYSAIKISKDQFNNFLQKFKEKHPEVFIDEED